MEYGSEKKKKKLSEKYFLEEYLLVNRDAEKTSPEKQHMEKVGSISHNAEFIFKKLYFLRIFPKLSLYSKAFENFI